MRLPKDVEIVTELGEDTLFLAGELTAFVAQRKAELRRERSELRAATREVEEAERELEQARRRLAVQERTCIRAESAFEETEKLATSVAAKARRDLAAVGFTHVAPEGGI